MKRRGLKNGAVAQAAGVHEKTVSFWRSDAQAPSDANLDAIAELLEVPREWLRYGGPIPGALEDEAGMSRPGVLQHREASGPSPAMRKRLPPKAYAVAFDYLERMRKAGASDEQIDMAEQLMTNETFSILNAREKREMTEADIIKKIHADWDVIQYALKKEGMKL